MRKLSTVALLLMIPVALAAQHPCPALEDRSGKAGKTPRLFAGFKGKSQDGVHNALSIDGYHGLLAKSGKAVLHQTETSELMRDPFLQRAPDGSVRTVWTWVWNSPTVPGYSASTDLVHWTQQRQLAAMANEPTALNTRARSLYYDRTNTRMSS